MANNPGIADATRPVSLPERLTDKYYLSIQGFHINKDSNVDGAKQYSRFFLEHPAYVDWLHSVPLHIIRVGGRAAGANHIGEGRLGAG